MLQNLFSVRNTKNKKHKIIKILGIKIKIKNKRNKNLEIINKRINDIVMLCQQCFDKVNEVSNTQQSINTIMNKVEENRNYLQECREQLSREVMNSVEASHNYMQESREQLSYAIMNSIEENRNLVQECREQLFRLGDDRYHKFLWNGIVDSSPDSFKSYILHNNIVEKVDNLKFKLDANSQQLIDYTLDKIVNLPDYKYAEFLYTKENEFISHFSTEKDLQYMKMVEKYLPESRIEYKLAKDDYDAEVFVYHHGLRFANQKIKNYVAKKDFIDAGAYIGDSALVFFNYDPLKVHSFEISTKSANDYRNTMKLNNVSEDKYLLNEVALADTKTDFIVSDNGGMSVKIFNNEGHRVPAIDLDSYVKENNLNVGFVKADVEGAMYKVLKGMVETIKKCRPVLSLAVYHSPEEFFETKPLLDEITKNLNYKIEFDNHYSSCLHIYGTIIWAYPKELAE